MVFCTCHSESEALDLARSLVDQRLAACVNVLPRVQSVYRWQGEIHSEAESLLLIKTTEDRFDALRDAIVAMHSYENPEIVAVPVSAGQDRYLAWIRASV